jgi:MYXO-CTERM domain-containing protein
LRALAPRDVLLSMGLLLAGAVLGYGFLCRSGMTPYSPHSDFIAEHVGTKQLQFDSLRVGGLPLWRGDKLSGYDALISPVSQFTYPLDVLFFFRPPLAAVGPTYWLHFLAAGIVYWLAAAALGLGFWPRLFVGTCGMFSVKLILAVYAGWLPNIPGVVFFPLLLAAVYSMVERPGLGTALRLTLAGAMCLHCGIFQLPYYAALFAGVYLATVSFFRVRDGHGREAAAACGWTALSAALALGLSAYLILPLAAEAPLLSRSRSTYDFFLSGHSIRWGQLETFVAPESLGTALDGSYPGDELWEDEGYFGIAALALAVFGAVWGRRRREARLLAGGFTLAVALSMDSPVLRALFDHAPAFGLFRIPSRFLFLASFFGAALAGVGLEEILERARPRPELRRKAALLAGLLVAFSAAEGAFYARRYLRMAPAAAVVPETDYEKFFAADHDVYRVAALGRATINSGWAALKGLQLIGGNDSFHYRAYREYFELLQGRDSRSPEGPWFDLAGAARGDMLDALNVKYVVAPGPLGFDDARWRLAAQFKNQPSFALYRGMRRVDLWIYANDSYFPRAFWAGEVSAVPSCDEGSAAAVSRADLRRTAVVCGRGDPLPSGRAFPGDAVRIERSSPGRLALSVVSREARYLVVSESWHPGWKARVDGLPAPVYRTDVALLGLSVPAGAHRVELDFAPPLWNLARAISAFAALVLLAAAWVWAAKPGLRGNVDRDDLRPK